MIEQQQQDLTTQLSVKSFNKDNFKAIDDYFDDTFDDNKVVQKSYEIGGVKWNKSLL